jgi:hypothetical protein
VAVVGILIATRPALKTASHAPLIGERRCVMDEVIRHLAPQPICARHQFQARDLLQSPVRWHRDDLHFLRAVITRADINTRETNKLAELHQRGKAVCDG